MSFIASVTDEAFDLSSFVPIIKVIGVGGAGGNAIANIMSLEGIQCAVANTDAQSLVLSPCKNRIQLGKTITAGLGAGALPDVGRKAALESKDEIVEFLSDANMVFITAGMGGGTGTGSAPIIAQIAREMGILTVAVVTKPFNFEGHHRIEIAEYGVQELIKYVDTIIVVANQKLFRVSNENTTFTDAFRMADEVLYSGVKCITDLITMPGLINLDFADVRTIMSNMGYAMMGSSESDGEDRASNAVEMAITNPLLENVNLEGAKGVLVNITGGPDMTLFEVNDIVAKIQEKIDKSTRLIFGAIFDQNMEGKISVAVVATGVDASEKKETQASKIISKEETYGVDIQVEKQQYQTIKQQPPYMQNNTGNNNVAVGGMAQQNRVQKDSFVSSNINNSQYKADVSDFKVFIAEDDDVGAETNDYVMSDLDDLAYAEDIESTTVVSGKFDNIENDMISFVGGNEFLIQEPHRFTKKTIINAVNSEEIDAIVNDMEFIDKKESISLGTNIGRGMQNVDHRRVQQQNNIFNNKQQATLPRYYEQQHIVPTKYQDTAEDCDQDDNNNDDIGKKRSIFARMASMIRDNKKDGQKKNIKRNEEDDLTIESESKIRIQVKNNNISKDDNQNSSAPLFNAKNFFTVIEEHIDQLPK